MLDHINLLVRLINLHQDDYQIVCCVLWSLGVALSGEERLKEAISAAEVHEIISASIQHSERITSTLLTCWVVETLCFGRYGIIFFHFHFSLFFCRSFGRMWN